MNKTVVTMICMTLAALLLAGCGSTPKGEGAGAPVVEGGAGMGSGGAEGARTAGAEAGGAWTGSPLNDPDSLLSARTVYFDFDESTIRPEYRDLVLAHAEYLAANPSVRVTLEGHADERGSREYNIALGERRARAVKEMMMARGASSTQINTVSYGEERPAVLGSDEAAWSRNRRVELVY
ncbi:MAG: peptidoglycan-associated lipoprotein Pal [Chromatiales bacterium]|jgi:peptidoglycan-associated lipoprotein